MSFKPARPVEVHVCHSHERSGVYPHWLLSLQSPGAETCTWIHSIGGPSQNGDYECSIQDNKSLNSRSIASTSFQGNISGRDLDRVIDAAMRVMPQQCRMYVVAVVAELEKTDLLPKGGTAFLRDQVQMSTTSRDHRKGHPVTKPAVAYTEKNQSDLYGH